MLGILLSNSPFKIFIPFICLFTSYVYRRIIAHIRIYVRRCTGESQHTHEAMQKAAHFSHSNTGPLVEFALRLDWLTRPPATLSLSYPFK